MSELNIITGSGKGNVLVNVDDNYFTIDATGQLTLKPTSFIPSYGNITAKLNATTPNTKVDVSWGFLYIDNIKLPAKSLTLNINAYGAGGLDDLIPLDSTWYYVYAICNDAGTTVSAILSASATAPTLPAGYTRKRWVSAVYRQSDGTFRAFGQNNTRLYYNAMQCVIVLLTASSGTEIDVSTFIPEYVSVVYTHLYAVAYHPSGGSDTVQGIAGFVGSYIKQHETHCYTGAVGAFMCLNDDYQVTTNNRKLMFYHTLNVAETSVNLSGYIRGFEVPL